jgi:hypothetical protein
MQKTLPLPAAIFEDTKGSPYDVKWMEANSISETLLLDFTSAQKFDYVCRAGAFQVGDQFTMRLVKDSLEIVLAAVSTHFPLHLNPSNILLTLPTDPHEKPLL